MINGNLVKLREKAAKLTTSPGVYIMRNSTKEIIYIGKAKNLTRRVSSYFRANADHTEKVQSMVNHVDDFDFIVTNSEYEALVLECSLIKQHQPKYNILLKDDKGYSYLRFSAEDYPKLTYEKNKSKPGTYLGPYMSGMIARETVRETNKVFGLPTCNKVFPRDFRKSRPCLNYSMHQCIGVCRGTVSKEDYQELIEQAKSYIQNGSEESVKRLEEEMYRASENLEFEYAAKLRDRIHAIQKAGEKQKIMDVALEEADVIGSARNNRMTCISVLRYRGNRLFDKVKYFIQENSEDKEILQAFLEQFYHNHSCEIPKNIILEYELENKDLYEQFLSTLSGGKVKFHVPKRGNLLEYLLLAKNNASEELALYNNRTAKEISSLEELGKCLGLPQPPYYIESYDISNMSSEAIVCGMVVFENGRPLKKAYKRFKMKENTTQDDYACMSEAIRRRLSHLTDEDDMYFSKKPDLILLDGGKGHVNTIRPIIEELGLDIPVFGMVKDDRHRTRAISTEGGEIALTTSRNAFLLLTEIQDEVHRYSVAYMHTVHKKDNYSLALTKVKGIGEKKAQQLLLYFKTMERMKQASVEELSKAAGLTESVALSLKKFLSEL